jgi:hypothetical protein
VGPGTGPAVILAPAPPPATAGDSAAADVRINELMAANQGAVLDALGRSPDWVELYNAGQGEANLEVRRDGSP